MFGIAAVIFILSDKSDIYCFLAFITPMAKGISYAYLCCMACVVLIFKVKNPRINAFGGVCILFILILELLSGLLYDFSLFLYVRFLGVFIICFFRMLDTDEHYDTRKMTLWFILGFLVAIASLWGQMLNNYSFRALMTLGVRFGDTREQLDVSEGMRISYNQNELGFLCLLAFWACFCYLRSTGHRWSLIFGAISMLQGFLTQSRAFTLLALFSILLAFLSVLSSRNKLRVGIVFVLMVSLAMLILNRYFSAYLEGLRQRFAIMDPSGNRTSLLRQYFAVWDDSAINMIFGVGLQSYSAKYDMSLSAHNSIQEILLTWGILGLLFVTIVMLSAVYNAKRKMASLSLWQYAPFFVYILATQSAQGFYDLAGILRLMVAYCLMLLPLKSRENPSIIHMNGNNDI